MALSIWGQRFTLVAPSPYDFTPIDKSYNLIFNEPIKWNVTLFNNSHNITVRYTTPAIKRIDSQTHDPWSKEITLISTFSQPINNLSWYEEVPTTSLVSNYPITQHNWSHVKITLPYFMSAAIIQLNQTKKEQTSYLAPGLGNFSISSNYGLVSAFNVSSQGEIAFEVSNLSIGQKIDVAISLPFSIPQDLDFYIYKGPNFTQVPFTLNEARDILLLSLQDGVIDDDGLANGVIIDPLAIPLPQDIEVQKQDKSSQIDINDQNIELTTSHGNLSEVKIVDPKTIPNAPPGSFPYKLTKFKIENVTEPVTVELEYPQIHQNQRLIKFNPHTVEWYAIPYTQIDNNTIQITLVDGGLGDDDGIVNGVIEDDLGIITIEISRATLINPFGIPVLDITEEMSELDNDTYFVPQNYSVRVVFETPLTNANDVTLYANATPTSVATITATNLSQNIGTLSISNFGEYRLDTDQLGENTDDTFDITFSRPITIDYIIDPTYVTTIGNITGIIDKLQLAADGQKQQQIIEYQQDMYLLTYTEATICYVRTFNVTPAGTIVNANLDEVNLSGFGCDQARTSQVQNEIFTTTFSENSDLLAAASLNISDDGSITIINNTVFSGTEIREPANIVRHANVVFTAGFDSAGDLRMYTFNVSDEGLISSLSNEYEYDTSTSDSVEVVALHDYMVGVVTEGPGNDGYFATLNVSPDSSMTTLFDYFEYNITQGLEPDIINISQSMVLVAFSGQGNDGFVQTINVTPDGLATNIDLLEYDTQARLYSSLIYVNDTYYAILGAGNGNDGFISVLDISTDGVIVGETDQNEIITQDITSSDWTMMSESVAIANILNTQSAQSRLRSISIDDTGTVTNGNIDQTNQAADTFRTPEVINLTDDTFAVVYYGPANDGYVRTFNVTNSGQNLSVIQDLEFTTTSTTIPDIVQLNNSIHLIGYQGGGQDGYIRTLHLYQNGSIELIDEWEFEPTEGRNVQVEKVSENIVAVASHDVVSGSVYNGTIRTISISDAGIITQSPLDVIQFSEVLVAETSLKRVSEDVFAIVFRGEDNDGFISTVQINNTGNISNVRSTYEFDVVQTNLPDTIKINDNILGIVYRGSGNDGYLMTLNFTNNGSTISISDFYEYDTAYANYPDITNIRQDVYAIAHTFNGNGGEVVTVEINQSGKINKAPIDTQDFESATNTYPEIIQMGNDVFGVVYQDADSGGWVTTLDINYNNPPEINLTYPINDIAIASSNNFTFNLSVTDIGGLSSCTLYHNYSTWGANETKVLGGEENTTFFNATLFPDGAYQWNARCCDNDGECAWAETNATFSVVYNDSLTDSDPPNITLLRPVSGEILNATQEYNFSCHVSDDVSINNVTLHLTNALNVSMSEFETKAVTGMDSIVNFSVTLNEVGDYSYTCSAFDTAGNRNNTIQNISFVVQTPFIEITQCRNITQSNAFYNITQDLHASATCLNISAENITVYGNEFMINHSHTSGGSGITIENAQNITINSTFIFSDADINTVSDPTGLYIFNSSNININGSYIDMYGVNVGGGGGTATNADGVSIEQSFDVYLDNLNISQIYGEVDRGIVLDQSHDIDFSNVSYLFDYRRTYALYSSNAYNITFKDLNVYDNGSAVRNDEHHAIGIVDSQDFSFENTTLFLQGQSRLRDAFSGYNIDNYNALLIQDSKNIGFTTLNVTTDRGGLMHLEGTQEVHFNHSMSPDSTLNGLLINYTVGLANTQISNINNSGAFILANAQNVNLTDSTLNEQGLIIAGGENVGVLRTNFTATTGALMLWVTNTSDAYFEGSRYTVSGITATGNDESLFLGYSTGITMNDTYINIDQNLGLFTYFRFYNDVTMTNTLVENGYEMLYFQQVDGLTIDNFNATSLLDGNGDEVFIMNEVFNIYMNDIRVDTPGNGRSTPFYWNGNVDHALITNFMLNNSDTSTGSTGTNTPTAFMLDNDGFENITFENGSFQSNNYDDIVIISDVDDGYFTFTNVTYNDAQVNITTADVFIERAWFLDVQVNDSVSGDPVLLAEVNVTATNGTLLRSKTTDSSGLVTTSLSSYVRNLSGNYTDDFSNYTINVTKGIQSNYTQINITDNSLVNVTILNTFAPPIVTLTEPEDNYTTNQSLFVNITFNASVIDDTDLANCSFYHNLSGTFVLNQTEIVRGTSNMTNFTLTNLTNTTFAWNIQCFDEDSNSTFGTYNQTVFVEIPNEAPTHITPILNATTLVNSTNDNLTCHVQNLYDVNEDDVKNITNWYLEGQPQMYAYYPFGPNSDVVMTPDYSGNQRNITRIENGAYYNGSGGEDGFGSYVFAASNDRFNLTNLDFITDDVDGEYSVYLRVLFYDTTNVWLFGDGLGTNNGVEIRTSNAGVLQTFVEGITFVSTYTVQAGRWYDIVYVQDSSGIRLYVDGEDQGALSTFTHDETSFSTTVGTRNDNSLDFSGEISELRVYGHRISEGLINRLYNNLTNVIPFQSTDPGDQWYCEVTPYDNQLNGTTLQSNNLVVEKEIDVSTLSVEWTPTDLIESRNVTVLVNISNEGNFRAENLSVFVNISLHNGSLIFDENRSLSFDNLTDQNTTVLNFSYELKLGTHQIDVYVDSNESIVETNESNNKFSMNITTPTWETIYGEFNTSAIQIGSETLYIYQWYDQSASIQSYYGDIDSSFYPFDLLPLNTTGDLDEADAALSSIYYNDSISNLYDSDDNNVADRFVNITIAGITYEVPVINSTNSSSFLTGILWDSADGGTQYDGSQDLVFVTRGNYSQTGRYGTYDYEISLPVKLRNQSGSIDSVQRIDEII